MFRGLTRPLIASALAFSMLLTGLPVGSSAPALAAEVPRPELLITEVVPATSGANQAYEFVEIYNPTDDPVDLEGYELQYFTAAPYTKVANRWPISNSVVPAHTAKVLWLKKFLNPDVPLEEFNQNYGVNLAPDQVFEVKLTTSGQGLHDSAKRKVGIARPDQSLVSTAYINDGAVDGTGHLNLSVIYGYAGDLEMLRIANGQPATPGTALPEQERLIPGGLAALEDDQSVQLTWNHLPGWGVTSYRIYQDGAPVAIVGTEATWTATDLVNGQSYQFSLTAIDAIGQESYPSTPVMATPQAGIDREPPAIPDGLAAVAEAGAVRLTWNPVSDVDLAGYKVYKDGALALTTTVAGATIAKLEGGITYRFTVSAFDEFGNESAPSEPVSATPTHEQITQEERGSHTPDASYDHFLKLSRPGPVIPGLLQDLVPQAIAYWPEQGWMVTSHYLADGRPSVLTILDLASGALVKSLRLYQENGSAYAGHAGGIAISQQHVWIASGSQVYWIDLADLAAAPENGSVTFAGRMPVVTNGSFLTYAEGVLWVGEFYHPPTYKTDPTHELITADGSTHNAWAAGYPLDARTDLITAPAGPAYVFSVTNKVQGMAISADSVILSQSYGRLNDSALYRYQKPDLTGAPDQTATVNGRSVPVWFLDSTRLAPNHGQMALPPLSEGLALVDDEQLYVLFESGATEYYSTAISPLERMQVVNLKHWAIYDQLQLEGLPEVLMPGESTQLQVLLPQGAEPALDVTGQVTFHVADPAVAEVSTSGTVTAKALGETTLSITFLGQTITRTIVVAAVEQLMLQDLPERLEVGESVRIRVEALLSDGSRKDVTAQATLTASHGGEVTVGEDGLITGVKPGEVRILAEYGGLQAQEGRMIIRPAQAQGPTH